MKKETITDELKKEKDFIILKSSNYHYSLGIEEGRQEILKEILEEIDDWINKHWLYFRDISMEDCIKKRFQELKQKIQERR